ncbi:unnamed protein product [Rhizophagus irregularis]|nr:unnamed protein product [Rhizophagus irregularis]
MVIKPKHATIFINWIQRKDANARISKDKYNFNLIYRGSRDGFDVNTMINKCNGQGACILVIKIKENGTLIGGYNPLGWNYRSYHVGGIYNSYDMYGGLYGYGGIYGSGGLYGGYYGGYGGLYGNSLNCWANTTESFIFSLDDGKDLKKFKISRVINNNCAIYESNNTLNFGNSDLIINGNSGTCNRCHYESSILDTNNFSIEDMEIFKYNKS